MHNVLYFGYDFRTTKFPEAEVRILHARKSRQEKTKTISGRIVQPFWVISARLNSGERCRTPTKNSAWMENHPGSVTVFAPEVPYWQDYRHVTAPVVGVYVTFTVKEHCSRTFFSGLKGKRTVFHDPDFRMANQIQEIASIIATLQERGFFLAQAKLYELINMLSNASSIDGIVNKLPFETALSVYLQNNKYSHLTNTEIARNFKMSVPTLFRKCGKISPQKRLLEIRIKAAQSRLERGESLKQIVKDLNFFDKSHFSNTFKKCVGISPKNYQKSFRQIS